MTGHIDRTIANVPQMTVKELHEWRDKVQRVLEKQPDDPDACRLLAALEDRLAQQNTARFIRIGRIDWEPYEVTGCRGFVDGVQVAQIFVLATHTEIRKEVYSVQVKDKVLPKRFHHIADAREAGWAAFQEMDGAVQ